MNKKKLFISNFLIKLINEYELKNKNKDNKIIIKLKKQLGLTEQKKISNNKTVVEELVLSTEEKVDYQRRKYTKVLKLVKYDDGSEKEKETIVY